MEINLYLAKGEKLLAQGSVNFDDLLWVDVKIWAEPKFDTGYKIELGGKKEKRVNQRTGKEEWVNGIFAKRALLEEIGAIYEGMRPEPTVDAFDEVPAADNGDGDFPF